MDTTSLGVYCQSRQLCVHSSLANQVPGSGGQLSVNGAQPPRGEAETDLGEATVLLSKPLVSARALSQLIGKLNAAAQAIVLALLFYRHLQGDLKNALASGDHGYENVTPISQQAQEELNWWQQHLQTWNGRCLLRGWEQIIISSDASSFLGWGATCNGIRTSGP